MALFQGEDLVSVTTPDGRTVQLPSSVASQLGITPEQDPNHGMTAAQSDAVFGGPTAMISPPGTPDYVPPSGLNVASGTPTGQETRGQSVAGTPPSDKSGIVAPDFAPGVQSILGGIAQPLAIDNSILHEQIGAENNAASGPSGGPAGAPALTDKNLVAGGRAGALQGELSALDKEKAASDKISTIEGDAARQKAAILVDQSVKTQQQLDAQAAEAQQSLADIQKKNAYLTGLKDKIANTKIDRTAGHPVLAWLGVALAGLGQAMGHVNGTPWNMEKNPALEAMYQAIDRSVAGQIQELDKTGKLANMTQEEIENLRKQNLSQSALHDTLKAGILQQTKTALDTITEQTTNLTTKARSELIGAKLDEDSAKLVAGATDKAIADDQQEKRAAETTLQHRQSIGLGYAGLNQAERHFQITNAREDQKLLDAEAKAAAAEARAGHKEADKEFDERRKENATHGLFNPSTKEPLLDPEGMKAWAKADELEKTAAAFRAKPGAVAATSAKAYQLKADELRGEATNKHTVTDADSIKKQAMLGNTQAMLDTANQMYALWDAQGGREIAKTSPEHAALKAHAYSFLIQLHTASGINRFSGPIVDLMKEASGGLDPGKMDTATMADALTDGIIGSKSDNWKKQFKALTNDAENQTMLSINYKGPRDKLFQHGQPGINDPGEVSANIRRYTTPYERALQDKPSAAGEALDAARRFVSGRRDIGWAEPVITPELHKQQLTDVASLVKQTQDNDPSKAASARTQLVGLANDSRVSMGAGVLAEVSRLDPALGRDLYSATIGPAKKYVTQPEPAPPSPAPSSPPIGSDAARAERYMEYEIPNLFKFAVQGDQLARDTLALKAQAGDASAQQAIAMVAKYRSVK